AACALIARSAAAQAPPQDLAARVDKAVEKTMQASGAPAVSVAVVRDGRIVLAKAYGQARLSPATPATPQQRFAIGSVSKQFTAAAVLLLAEDGKLSLDDPVAKWVPGLTQGDRITVRQVLSHTSGYRDYWPQDYVPGFMRQPTTPQGVLDRWARAPLDFQPGDQWQYSNTGYIVAGLIVEKASGQKLMPFLRQRIFNPLGMASVTEVDEHPLPQSDPAAYTRNGLGPPRAAPKEAPGWLFAAGELAMTPSDLARWDIARIQRKLLKPASWKLMETSVRLNNGRDSRYGLGVFATSDGQLRLIEHGGAISGFLAENEVWPDVGAALVVLTNGDWAAPDIVARAIQAELPLASRPSEAETARARTFLEALRAGRVDRDRVTADLAAYLDATVLADFQASLGSGPLTAFEPGGRSMRGGFTQENYRAVIGARAVSIVARAAGDRYEQFMVFPD
ncbi:MAG: beta-lactamase family protein, partial [Proteobacteria bacterium]|nr:beta-lactamase family protein [Pseudomonadota bacterium]